MILKDCNPRCACALRVNKGTIYATRQEIMLYNNNICVTYIIVEGHYLLSCCINVGTYMYILPLLHTYTYLLPFYVLLLLWIGKAKFMYVTDLIYISVVNPYLQNSMFL